MSTLGPHPQYGPCDGFGPGGACSACTGIIERESPAALPEPVAYGRWSAERLAFSPSDELVELMLELYARYQRYGTRAQYEAFQEAHEAVLARTRPTPREGVTEALALAANLADWASRTVLPPDNELWVLCESARRIVARNPVSP